MTLRVSIIFVLSILVSFEGCIETIQWDERKRSYAAAPHLYAHYEIVLIAVERPSQAESQYGDMKLIPAASAQLPVNVAEDQLIKIIWLSPERRLPFVLTNKSEQRISLLWEEAAFIDVLHQNHRVIHAGLRAGNSEDSQLPSTVSSNNQLADFLAPAETAPLGRSSNTSPPLFPCTKGEYCDQALALAQKGLTYQVLLPLQAGSDTFRYLFTFQVTSVEFRCDREDDLRVVPRMVGPDSRGIR